MDDFVEEADTLPVDDPTWRDVEIDDTDLLITAAPARAVTDDDPTPRPTPMPRPRHAAIFRAITESKLS